MPVRPTPSGLADPVMTNSRHPVQNRDAACPKRQERWLIRLAAPGTNTGYLSRHGM